MDETKVALAEDDQRSLKEKLKSDSKIIIDNIQELMDQLKKNYNDDSKFYDLLRVIHGRFSKIELNLNDLEKLKNVGI
jgi:mevalonate kinase